MGAWIIILIIAFIGYFLLRSKAEYQEFKGSARSLKNALSETGFLSIQNISWLEYSKNGKSAIERSEQKIQIDTENKIVELSDFLAFTLAGGIKKLIIAYFGQTMPLVSVKPCHFRR
jgi:hypothetical protein